MAILRIFEKVGRGLEVGEAPNLSCTREYGIVSDIPNESELVVRSSSDVFGNFLPAIFAPNPLTPGLRCTSVSIKQPDREDPFLWSATIRWSYLVLQRRARGQSSDPDQRQEDPLMRPALLKFGGERFQRAIREDNDGKQFRNAAGDWFDPPYMFDDSRTTFSVTKNVPPPFDLQFWDSTRDVVNKAAFLGFPARMVKLSNVTADEGYENNKFFYTKVATFQIAEATNKDSTGGATPDWDVRIANRGFHYLDNPGKRQPIILADGCRPSVPVNLTTAGALADEGDPTVYLKYRVYNDFDFTTLALGL